MTKRKVEPKPDPTKNKVVATKVVAITDQMEAAKQVCCAAARSGESDPVPDVIVRAIGDSTSDTLLTVWRAWDIYATLTDDGWVIRADRVR